MSEIVPPPEFSRLVPIDRVGPAWQHHRLTPDGDEARALAERFDLVALDALTALVKLRRVRGGGYVAVEGSFEARVTQTCVVTLDPVENAVADGFAVTFGPIGDAKPMIREIDVAADDEEPEPIDGPDIDIGELVAQHLALALDPFPRGPEADAFAARHGVTPVADEEPAGASPLGEPDAPPKRPNPFLVLEGGAAMAKRDRKRT